MLTIQEGSNLELRLKIPAEKALDIIAAHTEKVFYIPERNIEKEFLFLFDSVCRYVGG